MIGKRIVFVSMFLIFVFLMAPLIEAQPDEEIELISLDLKDTDISDVMKILSQKSGLNIVADKDVKGKIDLYINDVDLMGALDIIAATNGLAYEWKGAFIRVMSKEKYERRKKIQKPDYADASGNSSAIGEISTKFEKIVSDGRFSTVVLIDNLENIEKVFLSSFPGNEIEKKKVPPAEVSLKKKAVREPVLKKEKAPKTRTKKVKREKKKRSIWTPLFGVKTKKKKTEKRKSIPVVKKTPYEEYYLAIRQEINSAARRQDVSGLEGEVELQFTLDKKGFLTRGPVVLNKPALKLVRSAVNCVKKVSPFPPFSRAMKKEEAEFYVVVRYK